MKNFIHSLTIAALVTSPIFAEETHYEEIKDASSSTVPKEDSKYALIAAGMAKVDNLASTISPVFSGTTNLYGLTSSVGLTTCQSTSPISIGGLGQIATLEQRAREATGFMSCTGSSLMKYGFRFSNKSCETAVLCQKSLTNQENAGQIHDILNEIVAKDYGKNALLQNMADMEKLETLKRFALKKFDEKSEKCYPRYYKDKKNKYNQCNLSLLEEGFDEFQEKCFVGEKGCFGADELETGIKSYKNFKEKKRNPDINFLTDYFDYRAESKVELSIASDDDASDKLGELVTSEEFKKANADQKAELFLKAIGGEGSGRFVDPVLGYDFNLQPENRAKLKESDKFKELVAIYENKKLTKDSFIKDYDNYRKKRAKIILNDGASCKQTSSLYRLCSEVVALSEGKSIPKDTIAVEHLSSREIRNESDIRRLKAILGDKFNDKDIDLVVNSKRCTLHELFNDQFSRPGLSLVTTLPNGGGGGGRYTPEPEDDDHKSPSSAGAVQDSRDMASFLGGAGAAKEKEKADIKPDESFAPEAPTKFTDSVTPQVQTNNFANAYNSMYNPSNFDSISDRNVQDIRPDVPVKDETPVAAPKGADAVNDRISDLMKKLEAAEDRAAKIKAESEAAEADRIKQKKLDEENALIKDLRTQISDLKTQAKKESTRIAAAPVVETPRAPSIASGHSSQGSLVTRNVDVPSAKSTSVSEAYDQPRSVVSDSGSSSSSSGRAPASTAVLTASGTSAAALLPPGTVVTNVDGLTVDMARETILTRIMELNGASFYIEEDGVIKEVKPKVKDGKVLLDKDGKPMYDMLFYSGKKEKLVKKKEKEERDRAPASITTMADERAREERLKREALYKDLIQFSGGVIKKKD